MRTWQENDEEKEEMKNAQEVKKHLKGDIKMFKKEEKEDKELIKKLKKNKGKK